MIHVAALDQRHRPRIRQILDATAAFGDEEIDVALELFDEAHPPLHQADSRPSTYEFIGAFGADGHLHGYACFGATPCTDGAYDLYWIAMHPDTQRAGGGSRLLADVERRLAGRQARLLVAETSSRASYAATRRFYEGRGYRVEGRIAAYYGEAEDRLIYVRRFRQDPTHPGAAG